MAKKVAKKRLQTLSHGNKGFTLLELIVVLTIIGSMSLLIAPSFRISEDTAETHFAPFRTFIEKQRNIVMSSGKPAMLEISKSGKIKLVSLEKDDKDNYLTIAEADLAPFSFKIATGSADNGSVLLMPNGTMDALIIELDDVTKKLLYNGTARRGRLL